MHPVRVHRYYSTDLQKLHCIIYRTATDPTCGAGEYLLAALDIKIDLLKKNTKISKRLIREVVSTIYGNDVNVESIIITELRLLLFIIESCGVDYCKERMQRLLQNGEKVTPKQWKAEIQSLQAEYDSISKEKKTATELAYAEVISYNRKNLARELQNESRQHNR